MGEQELKERVRELMLANVKEGYSGLLGQSYSYIAPALDRYVFQWFWDTCFHVVMLARLGEFDLAKRNLRSLFAMQEDNGFVGQNYTRLASAAIDSPWEQADREIDTARRVTSVKQGQVAVADEAVSIPLYQLPTVFVWDGDEIGGPLQDNTVEGPFWNLEEWFLK